MTKWQVMSPNLVMPAKEKNRLPILPENAIVFI
jgi:hypothetical protein